MTSRKCVVGRESRITPPRALARDRPTRSSLASDANAVALESPSRDPLALGGHPPLFPGARDSSRLRE